MLDNFRDCNAFAVVDMRSEAGCGCAHAPECEECGNDPLEKPCIACCNNPQGIPSDNVDT